MNYYPGAGLVFGTAVLGSTVGQAYPQGTVITLCKLHGVLLSLEGSPVGTAGQAVSSTPGGLALQPTWKGVTVTASLAAADKQAGNIVGVDRVVTTTNEEGYFELWVIQGLNCVIACPSFGANLTINTAGLTDIDLSTFFA